MSTWHQPIAFFFFFPDLVLLSQKEKIQAELQSTHVPNGPNHPTFLWLNNKNNLFAKVPLHFKLADTIFKDFFNIKIKVLY